MGPGINHSAEKITGSQAGEFTLFTSSESGSYSLRSVLTESRFFGGEDISFRRIADSSETSQTGDLIVYRIGEDDPTRLIADAMARGAGGILTEQPLPCPLPQCIVGDIDLALAKIESTRLRRPDRQLLTVGVIGSAGKTTTALLVSTLLRASSVRTAYQTDLGHSDGVVQETSTECMPTHADLIGWIGDAVDCGSQVSVVEMDADIARRGGYDSIQFDVLIVTGSSERHSDFGPSSLTCALERLADGGAVIAPADDAKTMRLIRDHGIRAMTYGRSTGSDVIARIIEQSGGMMTLMVSYRDTSAMMETSLCGKMMADNHAAATLFGLLLGYKIEEIVEKVSALRTIPGRGQRISAADHAAVVIDVAGSAERVRMTLQAQREMKDSGRLWCVLAVDPSDREDQLTQYGTISERFSDHTVLTAKPGGKSEFLSASHAVLDGVKKCAAIRLVPDRNRAIEWAVSQARPSDTIVILTSERSQTAQQQRADFQKISEAIEQTRRGRSALAGDARRPQLKIVG